MSPPGLPAAAAVLRDLPDTPRWVEGRGMLLSGRGVVAGTPACPLAVERGEGLAVALGERPGPADLAAALAAAGVPLEAVVLPGGAGLPPDVVPGWVVAPATLFLRPDGAALPELPPGVGVRLLAAADLPGAAPPDLDEELRGALGRGEVTATIADGRPVSFCYAGYETETLWDISIDTLAPWRGHGYAAHAVAALIRRQAARGLRPVWGALDDNAASARVARRLGFAPVDRIAVMAPTPPREGLTPGEGGR